MGQMDWAGILDFAMKAGAPSALGAAIVYWLLRVLVPRIMDTFEKTLTEQKATFEKALLSQQVIFEKAIADIAAIHQLQCGQCNTSIEQLQEVLMRESNLTREDTQLTREESKLTRAQAEKTQKAIEDLTEQTGELVSVAYGIVRTPLSGTLSKVRL